MGRGKKNKWKHTATFKLEGIYRQKCILLPPKKKNQKRETNMNHINYQL